MFRPLPPAPYLLFVALLALATPAHAILTLGNDGRLLLTDTGNRAGNGASFLGKWGNFIGTAIAPRYFLTAAHVGGGIGDAFVMDGRKHVADQVMVIPGTDLAIWRVRDDLPRWAPLYDKPDEPGKEVMLYGRGCARGRPLIVARTPRGWLWGGEDGRFSWGRNRVAGIAKIPGNDEVLAFAFDQGGGDERGTVGKGDSGGAVFMQDAATWKLAAVIYASGGQYSRVAEGRKPFMAALYDARGLYQNVGGAWTRLDPDASEPAPTLAFATRVSPHITAIRRIIGTRESGATHLPPSPSRMLAVGAAAVLLLVGGFLYLRARQSGRL